MCICAKLCLRRVVGFHLPTRPGRHITYLPLFCSHVFFFDPSLRAKRLLYYRLMTLSPTNTPLVYLFFSPVISTRRRDATAPHVPRKKFVRPSHPIPSHPFVEPPPSSVLLPAALSHACRTEALPPGSRAAPFLVLHPFFYRLLFFTSTYVRLPFFFFFFFISVRRLACLVVRFIFFSSSSYGPQTNLKNPQSTQTNVIPPTQFFFSIFKSNTVSMSNE